MTENQECKEHIWYKQAAIRCSICGISSTPQKIILTENKRIMDYVEKLAKDYINPYYKSPFTFLEKLASLRLKEDEKK